MFLGVWKEGIVSWTKAKLIWAPEESSIQGATRKGKKKSLRNWKRNKDESDIDGGEKRGSSEKTISSRSSHDWEIKKEGARSKGATKNQRVKIASCWVSQKEYAIHWGEQKDFDRGENHLKRKIVNIDSKIKRLNDEN